MNRRSERYEYERSLLNGPGACGSNPRTLRPRGWLAITRGMSGTK
ncbi:hypothetical protein [Haladaptatus sp. CMAA 1911]